MSGSHLVVQYTLLSCGTRNSGHIRQINLGVSCHCMTDRKLNEYSEGSQTHPGTQMTTYFYWEVHVRCHLPLLESAKNRVGICPLKSSSGVGVASSYHLDPSPFAIRHENGTHFFSFDGTGHSKRFLDPGQATIQCGCKHIWRYV